MEISFDVFTNAENQIKNKWVRLFWKRSDENFFCEEADLTYQRSMMEKADYLSS